MTRGIIGARGGKLNPESQLSTQRFGLNAKSARGDVANTRFVEDRRDPPARYANPIFRLETGGRGQSHGHASSGALGTWSSQKICPVRQRREGFLFDFGGASVGPRDLPVSRPRLRRPRRRPWNSAEYSRRRSEGPVRCDEVTSKVFEIHEHPIGKGKKLAGPSDLRIFLSWSNPGSSAKTPQPWLGSGSARLGLRKPHLPYEANVGPAFLIELLIHSNQKCLKALPIRAAGNVRPLDRRWRSKQSHHAHVPLRPLRGEGRLASRDGRASRSPSRSLFMCPR